MYILNTSTQKVYSTTDQKFCVFAGSHRNCIINSHILSHRSSDFAFLARFFDHDHPVFSNFQTACYFDVAYPG